MTALLGASPSRATLRSIQHFKEDPRVKKLARSFAEDSRAGVKDMLALVLLSFMETLIFTLIIFCLANASVYVMHQSGEPWVATVNIIMFSLVIPIAVLKRLPHIKWLFKDQDSSLVEDRTRRNAVKRSRQAAKRLGAAVVPVLTEDHVASVERVHKAMVAAAESAHRSTESSDYERITVLLFENINREQALLSIISDRGIFTAKEVEAALRDMEVNTVGPVQSGWL